MTALKDCLTARLYQQGLERSQALDKGADMQLFDALEAKYKGGSIPTGDWIGFKASEPYSCAYHTGGAQGALLRSLVKESRV